MTARAKGPAFEADVYVARSSGTVKVKGKRTDYVRGMTVVRAGDPLLLAVPDKFVPLQAPQAAITERA